MSESLPGDLDREPIEESLLGPAPADADAEAALPARPPDDESAGEPAQPALVDLTLAEVLALGLRAPVATWKAFWAALEAPAEDAGQAVPVPLPRPRRAREVADDEVAAGLAPWPTGQRSALLRMDRPRLISFLLLALGLILALLGSSIMVGGISRTEARELSLGAPWLLLGAVLWLAAASVIYRDDVTAWWQRRRIKGEKAEQEASVPGDEASPVFEVESDQPAVGWLMRFYGWAEVHAARLGLAALGVLLCLAAYAFNGSNTFTGFGVFVWLTSVAVWLVVLTPPEFDLVAWAQARRAAWSGLFGNGVRIRLSWTALALIVIMLVAGVFRFARFDAVPPEMTSDHVEKLLDAQRVLDGTTQIFFPNNGGREPVQMYLVALFSQISGLGMTFATLKWVSVLEGLITIPLLWWMGRELIGEREPELGNAVGLILAALVAVSYWHVALSRLALRIVLTPLIMTLLMVYLARAMRHNRRGDFLKAGLVLGVGVYCYQAVRMMPVVVALGIGLAILFVARTWADRRRYLLNFATLIVIAVVVFVPLGRFMLDYPNLFWMRTAGRLFGDDVITETDPVSGELVQRDATLEDRLNAFSANLPLLGNNVRTALLMYNWKGDVAWINGAPNRPAMDWISGSLLALGSVAWGVRLFRRRDVVDWLILPAIFIMLLPSALSIAFPVENPSATRTSGSLPLAYFLAAYGLAYFLQRFEGTFQERATRLVSVGLCGLLMGGAFVANSGLYFGEYVERYTLAAQPYTLTGRVLRGFAESNGSYGNAFMVAYPYWFDHRAIGIEGGRIDWPNGLVALSDLAQKIHDNAGTEYAFDPERAVLFFYNQADLETQETLLGWFPEASIVLQQTPDGLKDFYTLIAPPPGTAWLDDFMAAHLAPAE